ncbi:uncharacterized protein LOC118219635 [Anguilla anguilla]|uniref:uncharacterized protein LOC118219635 n=1 Tax=Anguilla anguilla TaxID=7936 RepID=UPI0015A98E37|nr:uncharacterized protein LOC118219635 [Anguilla anguilla]
MKQSVVLLLIISGLGMPCSCLSRQFHFVNTRKNWTEARSYCREKYTDLAAIGSQEELEALMKTANVSADMIWVTFYDKTKYCQMCLTNKWFNRMKLDNVTRYKAPLWRESCFQDHCSNVASFICYNDNLVLVGENKTWDEAQRYCRQHYGDLVCPSTGLLQRWVKRRTQKASTAHVWLGLWYSCAPPQWLWVNGDAYGYQNWGPGNDIREYGRRGAVESGAGRWVSLPKTERLNFICSKCEGDGRRNSAGRQRLVLRVKLNISTSVNMADPTAGEAILQQMKMQLANDGITRVELTWRKQKDGEIFHLKDYIRP